VDRAAYAALVADAQAFLEGRHDALIERLDADRARASDRREYEEAARLRDLQDAIHEMRGASTIMTAEARDVDAVALAAGASRVWVAVLQVRGGTLVEHLLLTLDNELEAPLPEALPAFLRQFYGQGVFCPPEIPSIKMN
jgi:excinuclease ABC subunit C